MRTISELLRKEQLQIKPSKCVWGPTELPHLGFIVRRDGVRPDPEKIEAVTAWPTQRYCEGSAAVSGTD